MTWRVRTPAPRRGLSLLEVVVALAIFLFALTALSQLVTFAGHRAQDASDKSQAARLCQRQLAEVLSGAVPLGGQGDTAFDDAPDFTWSMTADPGPETNLYVVTITVSKTGADGNTFQTSLTQMVLDPAQVGNTQDTAPAPISSQNPSSGTTSSTTTSTPSTPATGGAAATGGGGAAPAAGGATAAPKAATPASSGGKGM
jgi:prepilin-type N-terminal cleavage/methylation domain-containing protein